MDSPEEVERMKQQGWTRVGNSTPGGPGDIYVSADMLATHTPEELRELVREQYRAAYASKRKAPM